MFAGASSLEVVCAWEVVVGKQLLFVLLTSLLFVVEKENEGLCHPIHGIPLPFI